MIKTKLLLIAMVATSILVPAAVRAQGISIELGDRPYYHHGPRYWAGEHEMIWVPGHRYHGGWVHGHYVRSSQHRHHNLNNRYEETRRDEYRDVERR